tara:strand:- start:227 stop:1336 length:1110 start_codon:yes stop_codon:yes gene_type:complete
LCAWSFLFISNDVVYLSDFRDNNSTVYENVAINPLIGIPRLLLMPILAFLFVNLLDSKKNFLVMIRVILLCYVAAALSIAYQIYFSQQIPWFTDSHMRGGYIRYASLLGSLSIYGSVAGYAIIAIFSPKILENHILKYALAIIISAAAIFSLTKTGVIMVVSAFLLMAINYGAINFKKLIYLLFSIFIFGIISYLIVSNNDYLLNYLNTVLNFTFGSQWTLSNPDGIKYINDTPQITFDYIIHRLTQFSSGSFDYYGPDIFLFGVGVWGGAGVMGYPDGVSSHSGLIDLLIIGGPIYISLFLILYLRVQIYFVKNLREDLNIFFFISNILFIFNMVFISGSSFQPSISIFFWLSVAYYIYSIKKLKQEY